MLPAFFRQCGFGCTHTQQVQRRQTLNKCVDPDLLVQLRYLHVKALEEQAQSQTRQVTPASTGGGLFLCPFMLLAELWFN